jgi:hypothetical protein
VLQLRELDLQLAFVRACALREDIEDQAGAVDDAALGEFFEIALLHRAQTPVDQDQIGIERLALNFELLGFAGADEIARIGLVDASGQRADDAGARRTRELAEFIERRGILPTRFVRLQEQRAFALFGSFEQLDLLVRFGDFDRCRRRARRRKLRTDAHVASRHDGGDRVLVDHLADGVAQQDDELIERFDRALQFDAVDEIDRHRHTLASQRIQKRILQ